ncbi:MAG: hypothetical protein AABZ06_01930 [Bdellovibrionota bacterium]
MKDDIEKAERDLEQSSEKLGEAFDHLREKINSTLDHIAKAVGEAEHVIEWMKDDAGVVADKAADVISEAEKIIVASENPSEFFTKHSTPLLAFTFLSGISIGLLARSKKARGLMAVKTKQHFAV